MAIINASIFYNNGRVYSYTGKAIYASDSNIVISQSYFNNNVAYTDYPGGAIYAQNSNVTVESSEFSQNFAYYGGGAIYMILYNGYYYELRINNTRLVENRVGATSHYRDGGGAIYIHHYADSSTTGRHFGLQLNNTQLYNNQAGRNGGAIYLYYYNRFGTSNFQFQMDNLMV